MSAVVYPKTLKLIKGLQLITTMWIVLFFTLKSVTVWQPYLIYLMLANLVVIALFWLDKRRAASQPQARISERMLVAVSSFGLFIGSLVARKLFKHKSISLKFNIKLLAAQLVVTLFTVGLVCFKLVEFPLL
ncbi:DUF1294 domain-containing protein (plasmid) [Pseudoalteromonas xiamenensis]|uniref:DUF1294 domain-containing protein n=1 Tax=Pseudoalteromonas xiamenensis TaxID=882626 RepID=UPI0027E48E38|nr:DUF1294 domain-containing protein [Pseudoalteromonas xiamenensis]WMN61641.1 DUF1294 domain-containing protein [Pseudoalteromonas xiamenensis]